MGHPRGRNGRRRWLARLLILLGVCLCAVSLLGSVLGEHLPADGFSIMRGAEAEGFFRLVPVEDNNEHLAIAITLVGLVLLSAGAILWRRGR